VAGPAISIPGHEVAGVIDEVGFGVSTWKKGDRAGVGWHGGQTAREISPIVKPRRLLA
jgi:D-arabinose 1-dehydrogenase-like Zn-dependent alcohol dehydrogenase